MLEDKLLVIYHNGMWIRSQGADPQVTSIASKVTADQVPPEAQGAQCRDSSSKLNLTKIWESIGEYRPEVPRYRVIWFLLHILRVTFSTTRIALWNRLLVRERFSRWQNIEHTNATTSTAKLRLKREIIYSLHALLREVFSKGY